MLHDAGRVSGSQLRVEKGLREEAGSPRDSWAHKRGWIKEAMEVDDRKVWKGAQAKV